MITEVNAELSKKFVTKHCIIRPLIGVASRVVTIKDVTELINAALTLAPVSDVRDGTQGPFLLTVSENIPGSSRICTWFDAVAMIELESGTINVDLDPEAGGGIMTTTRIISTIPLLRIGGGGQSEYITKAEVEYVLANTTFPVI